MIDNLRSRHCFESVATLVLFVVTKSELYYLKSQENLSRHISFCRDIMSIETNELSRDIISLCHDQVGSKL